MSFSTFGRINFEFWNLNNAKRDNNTEQIFKSLKNLHSESISAGLKKKHNEDYKKIKKEVYEAYQDYLNYAQNFSQNSKITQMNFNTTKLQRLENNLEIWEDILREILEPISIRKGVDSQYVMR